VAHDVGSRGRVTLAAGVEHTESMAVVASPARGTFRPNPAMGVGTLGVAALRLARRDAELAVIGGWSAELDLEGGFGDTLDFVRVRATARGHVALGVTGLVARAMAGWGSTDLPAYRSFVMGGRGTLVGEPFRAWGGRYALWGHVEWRLPVPVPAASLGSFASTGSSIILAPFLAAGWSGGAVAGVPWQPSEGVRPVAGLALEFFHRLFRADFGVSLRGEGVSLVVDVNRDLWEIL